MKYYDEKNRPIHIPNKNEDNFLRCAYYSGHTDVYIPYGENLYYYNMNALCPFVMKEFPTPGGVQVCHRNLEDKDLNSLFGFIEAYVVCRKTIKRPFLPYHDKNKTIIFPTGEFIRVYYSDELKRRQRERMSNGWEDEGNRSRAALFVALFANSGQGETNQADGKKKRMGRGLCFTCLARASLK
ncbi:hypothetical protein Cgig2_001258 [Carnegiea gigantea]|uniref:DNA-directed DNA polymerase n=1 Tax=Carnegiea gigantea TaxID=171969 RepID=A0A9Q1GWW9_9CARY|nr:hypothetical protein Cgig2_001258 [Carnegiea gigantea]